MIKSVKEKNTKIEVDLTGSDGNAFDLLGYAKGWAQSLEMSPDECGRILDDMRSGDYEHLVDVLEQNFGDIVTFYR